MCVLCDKKHNCHASPKNGAEPALGLKSHYITLYWYMYVVGFEPTIYMSQQKIRNVFGPKKFFNLIWK